jgi:hypothetical protein
MKIKIFYTLIFFFSISIILIIDFSLSKTIYKESNCVNFQYYKKGYYYDLKKNCESKYRFKSGFPTVDLFTDSNGLRVSKKNSIKDVNQDNIFLFGDSFTFGVGLNYEDTFAGIIEKKFPNYNFLNFAVGSYSPTVHLYRLNQAIKKKIIPKKIFVFLDLTDVIDESQRWLFDEDLNSPIKPEQRKKKNNNFFKKNFKLSYEMINLIRFSIRNNKNKVNYFINNEKNVKTSIQGQFTYIAEENLNKIFWKKKTFQKGLQKIRYNINEISKVSKDVQAKLFIVIYPWAETLYFGQNAFSWSDFGKSLCTNNSCKTIDAIPDFNEYKKREKNWPSKLYFVGDEHFNKGGARLLSKTLIKELEN